MINEFKDDVDWRINFNRGQCLGHRGVLSRQLAHGERSGLLSLLALGKLKGDSIKALDLMRDAQNEVYDLAHAIFSSIKMGLAHNMTNFTRKNLFGFIQCGTYAQLNFFIYRHYFLNDIFKAMKVTYEKKMKKRSYWAVKKIDKGYSKFFVGVSEKEILINE